MPYEIWACGSNSAYQLAIGNDTDQSVLQKVPLPALATMKPKSLVFGASHTLAILPDGRVFGCGSNEFGQLGIAQYTVAKNFIELPGRWSEVAAGWEFSILLSTDGTLYSCGKGPKGELGLGGDVKVAHECTRINLALVRLHERVRDSPVVLVKASVNHVVVQLQNGVFVGWGASRKGQLGAIDHKLSHSLKPPPLLFEPTVLLFGPARDYCVGRERTLLLLNWIEVAGRPLENEAGGGIAELRQTTDENLLFNSHNARSDSAGEEYHWNENSPMTELKVACGWSSVHVLRDGILTGQGKQTHGQVYSHEQYTGPIVDFEAGSEHGVFLTEQNTVYSWGWGEHGNCGSNHDESLLTELYNGQEKVVGMACGLATTWIVLETPE
ncbi:RCC1/BLIP-II [Metschnikowia bicuspidata]|uniref:RCC1/BLIP-II n=1 Tax=Metschnikowia bicuspidata TaxID=27322 RepID=A0A4P9ZIM3_9ASCO|nr:RCC1/BLIP-II [Metschnikowia bicuspidata]